MKKSKKSGNIIFKFFKWIGIFIILIAAVFVLLWITSPDIKYLANENPKETEMMRYRKSLLAEKGKKVKRQWRWVRISGISKYLIQAVLIAEDDKFYHHEGFDWAQVRSAMEKNIEKKRFAVGGSTITQQLAKNLFLKPTKNPIRKIREAVIAYKIEQELKKKRILELYLNVVEWGNEIYGAGAAAQVYFKKSASELTPAEAIRLASVLPNPRKFKVLSNSQKGINKKRKILAYRMYKRGYITKEMYEQALTNFGFIQKEKIIEENDMDEDINIIEEEENERDNEAANANEVNDTVIE